jgi:hypothetical protein
VNVVFALGSLFSERLAPLDVESTARMFFTQAKELFNFDSLDCGNVATVQALLLMGQYLQSTNEVNRCWYVFGLAIRTAQGLGMQLNEINNKCPPLERELRKRCWCGCLVMDTMLAMTFGRPMMIPSEHYEVEMPEPVDDTQITCADITPQPTNCRPPKILCFIHKVKLYVVLHRILKSLYQGKNGVENQFHGGDMMEFDQQLCSWKANLPPGLAMRETFGDQDEPLSSRPRNILYARYLGVRVLLTRPSLAVVARLTEFPGNDDLCPLNQAFALTAAESCVESARRLIDHIRANGIAEGRCLGASWYNTHAVFSAGLVLFAAQIIPALRARDLVGVHWKYCIELMQALSQRCSSARLCLSILVEIFNRHLSEPNGTRLFPIRK